MSQGNGDQERFLLVNVAARRLEKSQETVRRYIRQGRLEAKKLSPRKTVVSELAIEEFREQRE